MPASKPVARFRAQQWLILGIAMISMAVTISLGVWQLKRAAFKEGLAERISIKNRLPALDNTALNAPDFIATTQDENTWLHRRASIQGRWMHEKTVFLDNRAMQFKGSQRVGFYVATPLAIDGGKQVIWVQRGWVQRDFQDRSKLPALPESVQTVIVPGRLMARVSKAYELQGAAPALSAPMSSYAESTEGTRPSRIWQNLPVGAFAGKALLPMALLQTSPEVLSEGSPSSLQEASLLRDWPAANTGVAKHYGYAFQWFALSALLGGLYVWFQLIAPVVTRRHAKRR